MSKVHIIKNFSRHAASYDRHSHIQQLAAHHLLAELPEGGIHTILEIGCGTGYYTTLLKNRYPHSKITAIDISDQMIKCAKSKVLGTDIDFLVADAEELEIRGEYDLITANAVFHWFEHPKETIVFYKSLLRENGILTFSLFGSQTFRELHQALCAHFKKHITFTSSSFISKAALTEIMEKQFVNVTIKESFCQKKWNSLLELLTTIKYTGTNGFGVSEKIFWSKKTIQDIEEVYRKEFGDITTTSHMLICKGNI